VNVCERGDWVCVLCVYVCEREREIERERERERERETKTLVFAHNMDKKSRRNTRET
jgi:hypothetical protein